MYSPADQKRAFRIFVPCRAPGGESGLQAPSGPGPGHGSGRGTNTSSGGFGNSGSGVGAPSGTSGTDGDGHRSATWPPGEATAGRLLLGPLGLGVSFVC